MKAVAEAATSAAPTPTAVAQHMDEAAAQDAERGHDAGAQAVAQRAADDVQHVGARRQVEQPARWR